MDPNEPVRPLLPPLRKPSTLIAEIIGGVLTPVLFIGMLVTLRYTFDGGDWSCSGSGCLEEFDQLRGWTFPIPLFAMLFICTFGFVGALMLFLWGRGGRVPSFDRKVARGKPALSDVPKRLAWVAVLELALGGVFASVGQWLTGGILAAVGVALLAWAFGTATKAAAADRVLRSGVSAVGEITEVGGTGTVLNGNPLMRITFTIMQDDVPLFAIVHKEFVPASHMSRLQVGARLPVKVDPLDSNNIAIEWDKSVSDPDVPGTPAPSIAARDIPL